MKSMRGVILAAGDGGRLRPLTSYTPKAILEIGGRPIISYTLEALASAGILDICVVVGYLGEDVKRFLKKDYPLLTFVTNEDYQMGNALSLYAARFFVSDAPFVLCMGDHLIDSEIVRRLLYNGERSCTLCVDHEARYSSQTNDATRVLLDASGRIVNIGKDLEVWNAIDTGVFRMTGEMFPVIEGLMESRGPMVSISDTLRLMGEERRPFTTCDVSGLFWADVDTLDDYISVDRLLEEKVDRYRI